MNYNEDLKHQLVENHRTLLGVGPMSKNCVDATIDLANEIKSPIQMIASRRQIECEELGGGYANNWNTETFAKYVRKRDTGNFIILARDHGGPWQGTNESDLTHEDAMTRAKISYAADIDAHFDVLHLDPSLKDRPLAQIEADVTELFHFCEKRRRSEHVYECGTEETNGKITDPQAFKQFVNFVTTRLGPAAKFIVGQTGTLVKETRNVGKVNFSTAKKLSDIATEKGLLLKEHNLDYTDYSDLCQHGKFGIHSANIAPMLGAVETAFFLHMLKTIEMDEEYQQLIQLALKSRKWEKWVISDLSDQHKAVIAGHYVFSYPETLKIYSKAKERLRNFDIIMRDVIKTQIHHYMSAFGWFSPNNHGFSN